MDTPAPTPQPAPIPTNRRDVPEGFVAGSDGLVRTRATVALTSMVTLFLLGAASVVAAVVMTATGLVGRTGTHLLPVLAVCACYLGAHIARTAWPTVGRARWPRPLAFGLTAGLSLLACVLLTTGLLAA